MITIWYINFYSFGSTSSTVRKQELLVKSSHSIRNSESYSLMPTTIFRLEEEMCFESEEYDKWLLACGWIMSIKLNIEINQTLYPFLIYWSMGSVVAERGLLAIALWGPLLQNMVSQPSLCGVRCCRTWSLSYRCPSQLRASMFALHITEIET
jgi:hypothetical protein